MKEFYTLTKSGERVRVDADLAKQLVRSGKKNPEDFTVVEDSAKPTPLWSPEGSGWDGQYGMPSDTPQPDYVPQPAIPEAGVMSKYKVPTGTDVPMTPLDTPWRLPDPAMVKQFAQESRQPLAKSLAGWESLVGAIRGGTPSEADVQANYDQILNSPAFPERVATDLTTYIPGVGELSAGEKVTAIGIKGLRRGLEYSPGAVSKFANKYAQHAIDPVVQGVASGVASDDISVPGIAAGVVGSGILRAGAEGIGKLAESGFRLKGLDKAESAFAREKTPIVGSTAGAMTDIVDNPPKEAIRNPGFWEAVHDPGTGKVPYFTTAPGAGSQVKRESVDDIVSLAAKDAEAQLVSNYVDVRPGSRDLTQLAVGKKRIDAWVEDMRTLAGERNEPLIESQIIQKAKQYADVPEIGKAMRAYWLLNGGSVSKASNYLDLPQKGFSLEHPFASTIGGVTSPENLSRMSAVASRYGIPASVRGVVRADYSTGED